MKKFICGLIIGLVISGTSYAFRTSKPPRFTKLDDPVQITQLNNVLEELWNITNGKYTADVVTSAPTGTIGTEGNFKFSNVAGTYKLHAFLNGAWRSWTSD